MSDELLRERYKDTMLGRVHLKLYRKITGHPSEIASPAAQRHFVVEQHRQNHVMGTFLIQLLGWPQFKDAEYAALCAPPEVPELLRSLEISPLERPFFLEVKNCPTDASGRALGALISCDDLVGGGLVYTIIFIDEEVFPDAVVGYVEVRACERTPEPAISVLRAGVHVRIEQSDYYEDALADFAIKILNFADQNRALSIVPVAKLSGRSFVETPELKPPQDLRFKQNLRLVLQHRTVCTAAEVDLSLVKPYDLDFCLTYPSDVVRNTARKIARGLEVPLLVYWRDGTLICSDSYPFYLGYRKLRRQSVKVVILGQFPERTITRIQVGGPELIPPILVEPGTELSRATR